jgi:serine/threonine protein kinase
LAGKTPFKGRTEYLTFENIIKSSVEMPEDVDADATDLIRRLLEKDPKMRIGSNNLKDIKMHPFFKNINFETVRLSKVPYKTARIYISPSKKQSDLVI